MSKLIIEDQESADAYCAALKELLIRWEFFYSTKHLTATLVHEVNIMDILAALDEFEMLKHRAAQEALKVPPPPPPGTAAHSFLRSLLRKLV
jgi:hypothetical protein